MTNSPFDPGTPPVAPHTVVVGAGTAGAAPPTPGAAGQALTSNGPAAPSSPSD